MTDPKKQGHIPKKTGADKHLNPNEIYGQILKALAKNPLENTEGGNYRKVLEPAARTVRQLCKNGPTSPVELNPQFVSVRLTSVLEGLKEKMCSELSSSPELLGYLNSNPSEAYSKNTITYNGLLRYAYHQLKLNSGHTFTTEGGITPDYMKNLLHNSPIEHSPQDQRLLSTTATLLGLDNGVSR